MHALFEKKKFVLCLQKVLVSIMVGGIAMLFKETGATVFGVCLAYDLLVHSRLQLLR